LHYLTQRSVPCAPDRASTESVPIAPQKMSFPLALDRQLEQYAPLFAALGDDVRLKLIGTLSVGGIQSISQLTAGMSISRQGVAKHLRILAAAGWVSDVKVGRERLWKFDPKQLAEARRSLELIGREWNSPGSANTSSPS
jgi:DNA-binding transcriptional ArsR family regulator